jgi:hypothetical protein
VSFAGFVPSLELLAAYQESLYGFDMLPSFTVQEAMATPLSHLALGLSLGEIGVFSALN